MRATAHSGCRWLAPALALAAGVGQADFAVRVDEAAQRYTIVDGSAPVLTYNFGAVPVPEGVGGKYAVARSGYVHPVYGPGGEILTKDYSPDHPHHRGIYWAWPEVTYKGETQDLHALQGVFTRPVRIVRRSADADGAEIVAENVWRWGGEEPIVREVSTLRVGPEREGLRPIDVRLRFEALVEGVALARRGRAHYGGFNVRLSAREGQAIDKHVATNAVPWPEAWAELRGVPPGGREPVGVLLLQAPTNPGYPGDWIDYPNLNWLQPAFPAPGAAYPLKVGEPLELGFRLVIRHGPGLEVPPARIFSEYTIGVPALPDSAAAFQAGGDRRALARFEDQVRAVGPAGLGPFEERLIALLALPSATSDFKRWACAQLVVAGSDACVPAVAPILADDTAWMQAADALLARPGDAGLAALRELLPLLPAARKAAVCPLLGVRRDERAVQLLAGPAGGGDADVARAAVAALGEIGTARAARVLGWLAVDDAVLDALWDSQLRAADRLVAGPSRKAAVELYDKVWYDASSRPWHRAAALRGLARAAPSAAVPRVAWALAVGDVHLRCGAAAALRELGEADLASFRKGFRDAPAPVRLCLLSAWSERGLKAAEAEALASLSDPDPDLQLAAVRALRGLGSVAAVPPLLSAAAAGGDLGKEAGAVLAQMKGRSVETALRRALRDRDEARAAAAVELVARRRAPGYAAALAGAVEEGRAACAREALVALRNEGEPAQLAALRQCLVAGRPADRGAVAKAIAAICNRADDGGASLAAVLSGRPALEGEARAAMLAALPAVGGETALQFVARTRDEAAVRALINWPDEAGAAPLLAVVEAADAEPALRTLAASGFVQLAKRVLPPPRQKADLPRVAAHLPNDAARAELAKYVEGLP